MQSAGNTPVASSPPTSDRSGGRSRGGWPARGPALARWGAITIVALGGWGWAAWEHFVALPDAENVARVTYALDLIDRFDETEAHLAYTQLAADMKPWWDAIEDRQHRIQEATSDEARDVLIAERDASLVAFVQDKSLTGKIDLLVGSFDTFTRCLAAQACDESILARSISIDVKRIWRTFRPYVLFRRNDGKPEDRDYGRDLEDLYFRFVG